MATTPKGFKPPSSFLPSITKPTTPGGVYQSPSGEGYSYGAGKAPPSYTYVGPPGTIIPPKHRDGGSHPGVEGTTIVVENPLPPITVEKSGGVKVGNQFLIGSEIVPGTGKTAADFAAKARADFAAQNNLSLRQAGRYDITYNQSELTTTYKSNYKPVTATRNVYNPIFPDIPQFGPTTKSSYSPFETTSSTVTGFVDVKNQQSIPIQNLSKGQISQLEKEGWTLSGTKATPTFFQKLQPITPEQYKTLPSTKPTIVVVTPKQSIIENTISNINNELKRFQATDVGKVLTTIYNEPVTIGVPHYGIKVSDVKKGVINLYEKIPDEVYRIMNPLVSPTIQRQIGEGAISLVPGTVGETALTYAEIYGFGKAFKLAPKITKVAFAGMGGKSGYEYFTSEGTTAQKGEQLIMAAIGFTPLARDIYSVIKGKIEIKAGPFAKEQTNLVKIYDTLKSARIEAGELRLERLKELPKDIETLRIIKEFTRDKGLVVGGTTAIESMVVNGEVTNLRRIPRDLELYDPQGRTPQSLAKELAARLQEKGKLILLEGNKVGFKGIEGHGVNFQKIEALNLERYRYKIWTNPEGIKIADPLSTAFNKVADLLKTKSVGTQAAEKLRIESPEAYQKALYGKKVYVRYPKDVVGALSTAEQVIKAELKSYSDFSKTQIPIYQEIQMARFGRAQELIKPYLPKLKYEEAPIVPDYFKGKPAGALSGLKHVKSYTLEFERKLFADNRATANILDKEISNIKSSSKYEYIGGRKEEFKLPLYKLPKIEIPSYKALYNQIAQVPIAKYTAIPKIGQSYPITKVTTPTAYTPTTYPKTPTSFYNELSKPIYPVTYPTKQVYPTAYPTKYYPIIKLPQTILTKQDIQKLGIELKQKVDKKQPSEPGYNVYGKIIKTNKFAKINDYPLKKSRARDIGSYYVSNTLARTFRIEKTNQKAQPDYQFVYIPEGYFSQKIPTLREYKIRRRIAIETPEQFIQKSRFALSSKGEKRQIMDFRKQVAAAYKGF